MRNESINRIDPFGMRDVRWPWNGSVENRCNTPVYPLVSNSDKDHYEILYPGQSTPNAPGLSKDIDGVWVNRSGRWFFFPNYVGASSQGLTRGLIVGCDGVRD
jgi:hypothetical protein